MPRLRAPSRPDADLRTELALRLGRVRAELWSIAQTALAVGAAWVIASAVNDRPFFAPVAAVVALGVARGRRTARAIELALGVAVGIAVADLLVLWLGTGTAVLVLVVALTMVAALLVGAGTILVNQAAISAIIVVTLIPPSDGISPDRLVDALIGVGVALLIGQVLFPRDPLRNMARAAQPLARDLALALEITARALREGDPALARRALAIARATDDELAELHDAIGLARETVVFRRSGRRTSEHLPGYAKAAQQLDYAVRNTRVISRRAITAARRGPAPAELADALLLLSRAVSALVDELEHPDAATRTRDLALEAAALATEVLAEEPGLTVSVIIGQVRSTALDLLRGSGLSDEAAREALDRAVGAVVRGSA